MEQIQFEEFENYGQVMFICATCQNCNNNCKVKSISKYADLICKKFNKVIKTKQ